MVDGYTKVVLTVIAACLLWLCLWGPAPKLGTLAEAATETVYVVGGPVDVNIEKVGGRSLRLSPGNLSAIPVEVDGPVDVNGPVEVEGTVNVR
jgi:hypothetical protein